MALAKYGGGVVQLSGSIAGNTYARNRFGNYVRPRTKPVNPKSDRQVGIRTLMMYLAEQWRESPMTSDIREAWETYAASVNWVNRLGEQVSLTGFNMFMRGNTAMINAGGALVTAGPTDLGLPAGDPLLACTISAATQKLSITFDTGFDWVDEDDGFLSVYMHQPKSPSIGYFGGPFRFGGSIAGDSITPPTSPDATIDCPYTAVAGQVTVVEARIIRMDARCSTRFRTEIVTIAA